MLDQGEDGVYFWIGSAVQGVAASAIPAYGAAISTCNTAVQATGVTDSEDACTTKAIDLLASLIKDVCHAIGLDKVIQGIVWAWQQIPKWVKDGLGYAVDAIAYLGEVGDIASDLLGRLGSALASTKWLKSVGMWLKDQVLNAVGSRLGSWVRGAAGAVGEYASKLVDRIKNWVETGTGFVDDASKYIYAGAAALWAATGDVGKALAEAAVWLTAKVGDAVDAAADATVAGAEAGAEYVAEGAEALGEGVVEGAEDVLGYVGVDVDW